MNESVGPTLFVGSSIFEQWPGLTDTVEGPALNLAVGGTTSRDWLTRLPPLLQQHNPRRVVCYVGSNDLAISIALDETLANILRLATMTTAVCPFVYVQILATRARRENADYLADLAMRLRHDLPADATMIDLYPALADNEAAFVQPDGVHLTPAAYAALSPALRAQLANL